MTPKQRNRCKPTPAPEIPPAHIKNPTGVFRTKGGTVYERDKYGFWNLDGMMVDIERVGKEIERKWITARRPKTLPPLQEKFGFIRFKRRCEKEGRIYRRDHEGVWYDDEGERVDDQVNKILKIQWGKNQRPTEAVAPVKRKEVSFLNDDTDG